MPGGSGRIRALACVRLRPRHVDLWSARGELPGNLAEVVTRQKEIQYSSRTRANTDQFKRHQRHRKILASLLSKLPADLLASDEAKMLSSIADHDAVRTLRHPEALQRPRNREGVYTFDHAVDGRE
jgi:NTE family protein